MKKQKFYILQRNSIKSVLHIHSYFLYVEKKFKDLKEEITKLSTIIKKSKSIKRIEIKEVYQHEDQI